MAEAPAPVKKAVFYDMVHSNNAARIRLWIKCKGLEHVIERKVLTYPDLQTSWYAAVNPLKKMPAFMTETDDCVFESHVILKYLEDKYTGEGSVASFEPDTPEKRAFVQLLMRVHDLYIASPNCTQPGFSHSQGSMYLSPYETKWCPVVRCMDRPTRAAKLAEIWKQLRWLEEVCIGPFLAGTEMTNADFTWYPTTIFMEFMLPRVFQWPDIFKDASCFPKLAAWHCNLTADPIFAQVRKDIWDFWEGKETEGQFESIKGELTDTNFKWKYGRDDVCESIVTAAAVKPPKAVFYDMVHSNNAARIRLWIMFKGLGDVIERKVLTYPDLQTPWFSAVNPLKKMPAFVAETGDCVFESYVILDYLEDKYKGVGSVSSFELDTPEDRAFVQLLIRMHDLYIASPNCSQPGFSHSQGSMYLSPYETKWCAESRCMNRPKRAAKLAEIWKQLNWLEDTCKGPYLAGSKVTNADFTWYPTTIFMEFMLPRVFQWPEIFKDTACFPKLVAWHQNCTADPMFAQVRQEIWDFWEVKETEGQFESIKGELEDKSFKWNYGPDDVTALRK